MSVKSGFLEMEAQEILGKVLSWSIVVAIGAAVLVSAALAFFWHSAGKQFSVAELKVFVDAYRAIGVGFLVAILGVVLPQVLPAARDRFARFKESRVAYSRAKTAIMYLPAAMAKLPYEEALDRIREAHEHLHLAESYRELKRHLQFDPDRETWGERMYWQLTAFQMALTENAKEWDNEAPKKRVELAQRLVEVVKEAFRDRSRKGKPSRVPKSFLTSAESEKLENQLKEQALL